jgi:DNA-binding Lrp family transcriptional regulator
MNTTTTTCPTEVSDPINTRILAVAEDRIQGFHLDPLGEIARQSGVGLDEVIERIRAMLRAGTIRRVRQTLMSINRADGGLIAREVPEDKLQAGFDYLLRADPFSGHIVIRSTDPGTAGARYRLWTTLKVPEGYSIERHCAYLFPHVGATSFKVMPAKKVFALGVGHVRRRSIEPGARTAAPAEPRDTDRVHLSAADWRVLTPLKREFEPEEIVADLWRARAHEAGVPLDEFCRVAKRLDERGVIGRFSTFLEHAKPLAGGERVTSFNALAHWAVPAGREVEAGMEVGRHPIMTHCYWREGGAEFNHVNIMGVIHGTDRETVLAHKRAIDRHLAEAGIPVPYTAVFWGGRSEIKPSEISPVAYRRWCERVGLDADAIRE